MTGFIQVESSEKSYRQYEPALLKAVHLLLDRANPGVVELTILLSDNEAIRELNQRFMGKDEATDVLSFPIGDQNPETGKIYLGDVAISVPLAEEQSRQRGHSIEAELVLLAVHGTLHLLGYDHIGPVERKRMFEIQAETLQELGYRGVEPSE
jgi:probable rRNA maturation factor